MTGSYKALNGKEPLLVETIFQVRFHDGFRYLDNCGDFIADLIDSNPSWICEKSVPTGCELINLQNGMKFEVNASQLTLQLDRKVQSSPIGNDDFDHFKRQADFLTELSLNKFKIKNLKRIGYRELILFGSKDDQEAKKWMEDLGIFTINTKVTDVFESTLESSSVALVLNCKDKHIRLSLSIPDITINAKAGNFNISAKPREFHENQRQRVVEMAQLRRKELNTPEFGCLLDFDGYVWDPELIDAEEFITNCHSEFLDKLRLINNKTE